MGTKLAAHEPLGIKKLLNFSFGSQKQFDSQNAFVLKVIERSCVTVLCINMQKAFGLTLPL